MLELWLSINPWINFRIDGKHWSAWEPLDGVCSGSSWELNAQPPHLELQAGRGWTWHHDHLQPGEPPGPLANHALMDAQSLFCRRGRHIGQIQKVHLFIIKMSHFHPSNPFLDNAFYLVWASVLSNLMFWSTWSKWWRTKWSIPTGSSQTSCTERFTISSLHS